jgi:chromosome segregation ATPase
MGFWSSEPEEEVSSMKETKRALMDALDSVEDEMEAIKGDIDAKKDEKAVVENEIREFQYQLQKKQTDANRLESAIAAVSGKRSRS